MWCPTQEELLLLRLVVDSFVQLEFDVEEVRVYSSWDREKLEEVRVY